MYTRSGVLLVMSVIIAGSSAWLAGCSDGSDGDASTAGDAYSSRAQGSDSRLFSVNAGPQGIIRESVALLDSPLEPQAGDSVSVRVRVDRATSASATAGFYYRDAGGEFFHFGIFPGQGRGRVYDSDADRYVASEYRSEPYRIGQWYQLEAVFSDTTVKMFVDGVEVGPPGGLPFITGSGNISLRVRDCEAVFTDLSVTMGGAPVMIEAGLKGGDWVAQHDFAWKTVIGDGDGAMRGSVLFPAETLASEAVSPGFDRSFELLRDAGVSEIRVLFLWQDIQPEGPESFYWERLDAMVIAAHKYDIEVLAVLLNAPAWAVSPEHRGEKDFYAFPPVDNGDVDRFTRAVVARYEPGGELAVQQGWGNGYGVRDYECGTEYNAGRLEAEGRMSFSGWMGSLGQYVDYLKASHDAIKAECPECLVVSGAAADDVLPYYESQTDPTGERQYVWQGVEDLYAEIGSRHPGDANAADLYFDVMNIHTYQWRGLASGGANPDAARDYGFPDELWYRDRLTNTLAVMEKYGDGDKELWLTETAYASRDNGDPNRGFLTEAGQAEALAMVYREAAAFPQVGRVFWWHAFDTRTYSGLISLPSSPKDSYWMFAFLAGRRDRPASP